MLLAETLQVQQQEGKDFLIFPSEVIWVEPTVLLVLQGRRDPAVSLLLPGLVEPAVPVVLEELARVALEELLQLQQQPLSHEPHLRPFLDTPPTIFYRLKYSLNFLVALEAEEVAETEPILEVQVEEVVVFSWPRWLHSPEMARSHRLEEPVSTGLPQEIREAVAVVAGA